MSNMPLEFQKTEAISFPADCCVFACFAADLPDPTHCFAYCFVSDV